MFNFRHAAHGLIMGHRNDGGHCVFCLMDSTGDTVTKGQGIGHFEVGGSTTLLIFEKNAVEKILVKRDRKIKMGEPVVVLQNPAN